MFHSGDNQAGAAVLSSVIPTLTVKGFTIFPADHRSFLFSFVSHAALVLLIASGIWVGQRPILKTTQILTSKLTYLGSGGGGGGNGSSVIATKGTPPKFSNQQLAPPVIVVRNPNPALPVDSTLLGAPLVKLPQSNQIGALLSSNVVLPSNKTGSSRGAGVVPVVVSAAGQGRASVAAPKQASAGNPSARALVLPLRGRSTIRSPSIRRKPGKSISRERLCSQSWLIRRDAHATLLSLARQVWGWPRRRLQQLRNGSSNPGRRMAIPSRSG